MKACSQAVILDFMVQFQNIVRHGKDQPLGLNFYFSTKQETPEV